MESHWKDYWPMYALLLVALAIMGVAVFMALHGHSTVSDQCDAAGGVELRYADYDEDGVPHTVWCYDANGDVVDVPEWS